MLCDFCQLYYTHWCFPGGSAAKNPPAMQETRIWSLSWQEPFEKEMANHSSILAWKIPWTEEPVRLPFTGSQETSWTQLTTNPPPPPPYTHMFLNSVKINNFIRRQKWSFKRLAKKFYSLSQLPQKSHHCFNFFKHGIFSIIIIILELQVSEIKQYVLLWRSETSSVCVEGCPHASDK